MIRGKPTKQASKAHHEAEEEPDPGADGPEAAVGEADALAAQQAVRDGVNHEH